MSPQQRPPDLALPRPAAPGPPPARPSAARPSAPARLPIDWADWLRRIERRRRQVARAQTAGNHGTGHSAVVPHAYLLSATRSSFLLEGLHPTDVELEATLAPGAAAGRAFRSRLGQRLRNHVAVLCHLEKLLARGETLTAAEVVRWYTALGCGLSVARLDEPTLARLEQVVRQVNSPHLRLQPAIQEVARVHLHLLADPLVPSFHGILARLLLRYHLGRCRLPPVIFDPVADAPALRDEQRLLARLLELIDASYAALLKAPRNGGNGHNGAT